MALSRHARKKLGKVRLLKRAPDPNAPGHSSAALVACVGVLHIATGALATYQTGEIAQAYEAERHR